jgi:hypothetical protein
MAVFFNWVVSPADCSIKYNWGEDGMFASKSDNDGIGYN